MLPSHGSTPILTFVMSPIFQTKPSEISEKDFHKALQIMDPFGGFMVPISLIQSRIRVGETYLWMMTSIHRLLVEMSLQPIFAAKDFTKKKVFLMSQPPITFGLAIWSHLT